MKAKLVVVEGNTQTKEVKLRLPTRIGRGRDASLRIAHGLVSREHCEIFEKDGHLVIRDLKSMNGTFVDGQRIEGAVPFSSGQLLTIGNITFRLECLDPRATHGGTKDETTVGVSPFQADDSQDPEELPDLDAIIRFDEVEDDDLKESDRLPLRTTPPRKKP